MKKRTPEQQKRDKINSKKSAKVSKEKRAAGVYFTKRKDHPEGVDVGLYRLALFGAFYRSESNG